MMSPPICLDVAVGNRAGHRILPFIRIYKTGEAASQLLHGFGDCTRGTRGLCTDSTPR
ncbi:hypothetical protein SSAG_06169 [Streptomyces sp. Mg1]|nr:hypothetical protein SSAG_06169 [Streptomyces sp. Mg1]